MSVGVKQRCHRWGKNATLTLEVALKKGGQTPVGATPTPSPQRPLPDRTPLLKQDLQGLIDPAHTRVSLSQARRRVIGKVQEHGKQIRRARLAHVTRD